MKTRDQVVALARAGKSGTEIAKELSLSKATVSSHLKRHLRDTGEDFKPVSVYPQVQALLDSGLSCRQAADSLGISKMSITHAINRGEVVRPKRTNEKSLIEYTAEWMGIDATPHFRRTVRKKMVEEGRATRSCSICGLVEWRGLPAPLELDHIDGEPTHNDIANLRILCLHCHTQTPTFGWRNVHRKNNEPQDL